MMSSSGQTEVRMKTSLQDHVAVTETNNAVKVRAGEPHLVSLGSGRLSTAVTILPLSQGLTRIGTKYARVPQDILLEGSGIQDEHCILENDNGLIIFHPIGQRCVVDNMLISGPIKLSQVSVLKGEV